MNDTVLVLLIAVLLGIIVGILLFVYNKYINTDENKAKEFIKSLKETILKICNEIIDNYHYTPSTSLEEVEKEVLEVIYDNVYDFIMDQLKSSDDPIVDIVAKLITKEFVINQINIIAQKSGIIKKIDETYIAKTYSDVDIETPSELSNAIEEKSEEIEAEDKKLEEEFSNSYLYNTEEVDSSDLPPAEEDNIPEEELEKLNPPKEDDQINTYNSDDDSEELIDESKLIAQNLSNGSVRFYTIDETGKKKRIPKSEAIALGYKEN